MSFGIETGKPGFYDFGVGASQAATIEFIISRPELCRNDRN
jgi:hypothetical protein